MLSILTLELSSIKRYRGFYMGQDVAVKVLRPEHYNNTLEDEFKQEVSIFRYDAVICDSSDCSKISIATVYFIKSFGEFVPQNQFLLVIHLL